MSSCECIYLCCSLFSHLVSLPTLKSEAMKEFRVWWPTSLMAQRDPPMSEEKVTEQMCPEIVVLNKD